MRNEMGSRIMWDLMDFVLTIGFIALILMLLILSARTQEYIDWREAKHLCEVNISEECEWQRPSRL